MLLASRSLVLFLCVTLWGMTDHARAQGPELVKRLEILQEQVDGCLNLLRPILGGQPLAAWNGLSDLSPTQVEAIMSEVGSRLEAMREPLSTFSDLASTQLRSEVAEPVLDDISIATRDLGSALIQLPIAVQAHQDHALHTGGCKHDNVPLLAAVELVRDLSATLSVIDGTFQLFGISERQ
jgi:hypothetical protein